MRLSVNQSILYNNLGGQRRSKEQTIKLIKDAGFDAFDYDMCDYRHIDDPAAHERYINTMREYCDGLGIAVNQSHAPFFEGVPMPDEYEKMLLQCVEDSAVLGADVLVVHADTWYEPNYIQWDYDKVLGTIYNVYAPVVELAAKRGVKIAMETLFEHKGSLYHRVRFSSFVEEVDDIVGKFNCDTVGVCWDFGHCAVAYKADQFKAMKQLKSKIIATHMHDNLFLFDNHSMPYQGFIDWSNGLKTLAEKGYEGDLTFELGYVGQPDELVKGYLDYAHKLGRYMQQQFELFKNRKESF